MNEQHQLQTHQYQYKACTSVCSRILKVDIVAIVVVSLLDCIHEPGCCINILVFFMASLNFISVSVAALQT